MVVQVHFRPPDKLKSGQRVGEVRSRSQKAELRKEIREELCLNLILPWKYRSC
jgi:hypothetical protein